MTSDDMPLVRAMMVFSARMRRYWASRMGGIPGGERLSERDWQLMEHLKEKGEIQFEDAVAYAKGRAAEELVGFSAPAITQSISRMTKQFRLLQTKRTKADERRKTISLTAKGKRLVAQREALRKEMFAKVLESWGLDSDDGTRRAVLTKVFQEGAKRVDEVFGNEA